MDAVQERTRAMSFIDPVKPQPCDISLSDFEMLKVLGKGTFGKVMLVRQKSNGEAFAMKVLKKDFVLEKGELVHTLTENSVLAKCNHPFITSLKYSFQTPDHLFFIMEYVNGGEVRSVLSLMCSIPSYFCICAKAKFSPRTACAFMRPKSGLRSRICMKTVLCTVI